MNTTFKLIAASPDSEGDTGLELGSCLDLEFCQDVLQISNNIDPTTVLLAGVRRIELAFPKFTDGRAYSQAFLLRRRLGFTGDLRATGDVLVDQLQQMQRCGFSSAVLRADQDLATAQRQLERFDGFYQGDARQVQPPFATAGAAA
ncbi:DUF934 domain-containing protein [Rhodoferax sp. 4810]|nr:DUF934 domain-containing protein [Rhodoferax jenense]